MNSKLRKILVGAGIVGSLLTGYLGNKINVQKNLVESKSVELQDGRVHSFAAKPDSVGSEVEPIFKAFYNEKMVDDKNKEEPWFNISRMDKNRDGIVHISNGKLFDRKDLALHKYGRNAIILSDGVTEKILDSNDIITPSEIEEDCVETSNLEVLLNDVDDNKFFIDPRAIKEGKDYGIHITPSSKIVKKLPREYLVETPESGDLFLLRNNHFFVNRRAVSDVLKHDGRPYANFEAYDMITNQSVNGDSLLTDILTNPAHRVVVFGENHDNRDKWDVLTNHIPDLKAGNFALGLEMCRGEEINGMTTSEFFRKYNAGEIEERAADRFLTEAFNWDERDCIKEFHDGGLKIIPMENRDEAHKAYFERRWAYHKRLNEKNPELEERPPYGGEGFVETRDSLMHRNIRRYLAEHPNERIAQIIGRDHLSKGSYECFGGITKGSGGFLSAMMGSGPRVTYKYQEPNSLGRRLAESTGDYLALVSLMDYSKYDPEALIGEHQRFTPNRVTGYDLEKNPINHDFKPRLCKYVVVVTPKSGGN